MERGQFTFYRSYFEALKNLRRADRLAAYDAICAYALDEEPPALTGAAATAFILIKPTLDSARKRAQSGSKGGKVEKQDASKPEAKRKQTAREIEKEIEIEIENECYIPPKSPKGFDAFWSAYPKKKAKGDAQKAWKGVKTELSVILSAIEGQKQSIDWQKDGGKYIPYPATWLRGKRWEDAQLEPAREPETEIHEAPPEWDYDPEKSFLERLGVEF